MKPVARIILVSSLALVGVVTTYIILKRRCKRRDAYWLFKLGDVLERVTTN